jgi:predicted MFS family arabinose efflux permease
LPRSDDPDRSDGPSGAVVAAVCAAQILGMAGYSTVPALLPQFIESWSLSSTQAGWLAGILFAGYMLGVLPLVGLTDRLPARSIYLASSALGALSSFGVALSDGLVPALGCRAVAGIALAGMYMPGLRALTDGMAGTKRARVAAFYTSAFTIGVSLSFLFGQTGTLLGWRSTFLLAGILGTAGVAIAWAGLPRAVGARAPRATLDFRPVLANRDAIVLILAYAAAIWGSAGLRQWIVVFLAFSAAGPAGAPAADWSMLAVGALINFLGVPAGLIGNELALRFGLRNAGVLIALLSALAGGVFGLAAMLPYVAIVWLSLIAGFIVQGNFSNLTSGILAVADPRHIGATVALYSCIGFGGGFLGTLVFGVTLDALGGATLPAAWALTFATGGLACLAGAAATAFLSRDVGRKRAA